MPATTTSSQFSLNWSDILKGLLLAVVTPILTIIMTSLQNGSLTLNWKAIIITGLGAGLAYIIKNFFTPSAIVIKDAPAQQIEAVKQGVADVKVVPTK